MQPFIFKKIWGFLVCTLVITHVSAQSTASPDTAIFSTELLKLYPVFWQQNAAEYRALCYQAFNTAAQQLNFISRKKLKKEQAAIVTDLDETILNNSYLEAHLIKQDEVYTNTYWKQWTDKSAATAVPGAVQFLQAASAKGITIFYISNRDTGEVNNTLINLKNLQLPNADTAHMLFLSNTSSKETRRQTVEKNYKIIMLLGDNLNDFMNVFEHKTIKDRFAETDEYQAEWGKKFIVLPNCTYGDWESAFQNYQHRLSAEEKKEMMFSLLEAY